MLDLDPLDDNLLKEARLLILLLLHPAQSFFENRSDVALDDAVWGQLLDDPEHDLMPDGTFVRGFSFGQKSNEPAAAMPARWLSFTFRHNPVTGVVEDVTYVYDIEPEDKFWWLMWFAAYLKRRGDIRP